MSLPDFVKAAAEQAMKEQRVTEELIKSKIKGCTYTLLPAGRTYVCELTLENGFTVRGDASVLNPARMDETIGKQKSYERALDQIWQLEAYLLKQRIFEFEELKKAQENDID